MSSKNIYESGNEEDIFTSLLGSDDFSSNEGASSNVRNVQYGRGGVHAIKNRLHNAKYHSKWGFNNTNAGGERSFELANVRKPGQGMEPTEVSPLLEDEFQDNVYTTMNSTHKQQPRKQNLYHHPNPSFPNQKSYHQQHTSLSSTGIIRNQSPLKRSSFCMWCTGCFCFQCVRTKQMGVVETFGQVSNTFFLSCDCLLLFFFFLKWNVLE